jgi:succinate dehydrogenase hydrophobic anchor subunit
MKAKTITAVVLAIYVLGYLGFRITHQEVWSKDQKTYVIFPSGIGKALYYVWRPLEMIDAKLTGMNFHIGPHQE